jgi:hypothetical protein
MTDYDRVSINRNGTSVQVYFAATFAQDSTFPLDANEDAVAYVTAVGVHIVPVRHVPRIVNEPIQVEPPPRESLPPSKRPPPDVDGGDADDDSDADLADVETDLPDHEHTTTHTQDD